MIFRHRLSLQNARKKQNSDFDPGSTEGYPLFTEGNNASSCCPGFVIYFLLPPDAGGSDRKQGSEEQRKELCRWFWMNI